MPSGSPPHTRERHLREDTRKLVDRITPAYAGKTVYLSFLNKLREDHPRIRGKDGLKISQSARNRGSPPHTRERLKAFAMLMAAARITPAYAGKTLIQLEYEIGIQDHPRIRGKDCNPLPFSGCSMGSPPHTRERRKKETARTMQVGITPAYAGKTFLVSQPIEFT